jgi:hypothetical protein
MHDAARHDDEGTLATYGALIATYGTVVAAATVALGRRGKLPDRVSWSDIGLAAAASNVLSRRIAKDKVTRPVRAPFTEVDEPGAPGEVNEHVRASAGPRRVIGELLACPFCLSQWIATGFVLGLAVAPKPTRLVASVFAVSGMSDQLQFVRTALERQSES